MVRFAWLFLISPAAAAFDPTRIPSKRENWNIDEADPSGKIICPDIKPYWNISVGDSGLTTDSLTLLQICAKPQYGGTTLDKSGVSLSVGAWCRKRWDIHNSQVKEYQPSDANWKSYDSPFSLSQNLTLMLYCSTRCFCATDVNEEVVLVKPKELEEGLKPREIARQHAHVLSLDLPPEGALQLPQSAPFLIDGEPQDFEGHEDLVIAIPLMYNAQVDNAMTEYRRRMQLRPYVLPSPHLPRASFISLNPANEVHCEGSKPSFNLPSPFTMDDFETVQDLCANALSGGNPAANAGAYCHRLQPQPKLSDPKYNDIGDVWFSDEVTPRVEWTWSQNFRFSIMIRKFCTSVCACPGKSVEKSNRRTRPFFLFTATAHISEYPLRETRLEGTTQDNRPFSVTIADVNGNPPECNKERTSEKVCQYDPWPVELIGKPPGPHPPKEVGEVMMCGTKCQGPAARECSGYRDKEGCECVLPSTQQARLLGLDAVAPAAICLSISLLEKSWRSRYYGRSLEKQVPLGEWKCMCNSTHASTSCCNN